MGRRNTALAVTAAVIAVLATFGVTVVRDSNVLSRDAGTQSAVTFNQASTPVFVDGLQSFAAPSSAEQARALEGATGVSVLAVDAVTQFRRRTVSADPNELAVALRSAMQCLGRRFQRAEDASKGIDTGEELFRALPEIVQRAVSQRMASAAQLHLMCTEMGISVQSALNLGNRVGENSLPARLASIQAPARSVEPGASQKRDEERRATLRDLAETSEESRTAMQTGAGQLVRMAVLDGALKGAASTLEPAILEALIACGAGAECGGNSLNRPYFCAMTNGRACGGVTVNDAIRNALSASEQEEHNRAVLQIREAIQARNTKFFGL
jgi:hypothetical protein